MKKTVILLIILFTLLFPTTLLRAQEENLSTSTQYFEIKMERTGQSAWNKAVTYTVYVTPKIDSPKTQILWDAPASVEVNPRHNDFMDMYRGQTYTLQGKVKAKRAGNFEISVNLIAWQHDTNYTNSVSDIITFNQDLLAVPVDPNYSYKLIGKYLIIALVVGVVTWGVILYSKKGMKIFKKWITPPN